MPEGLFDDQCYLQYVVDAHNGSAGGLFVLDTEHTLFLTNAPARWQRLGS